jgi:hypothetical protein
MSAADSYALDDFRLLILWLLGLSLHWQTESTVTCASRP